MKSSCGLFLLLFLLFSFTAVAAEQAKIAVAAEGGTPTAQVSAVAARCPYFLLFDEKGGLVEAMANPHQDELGEAGAQAVAFLAGEGVSVVVAGAFGKKMVVSMQDKRMSYLEFTGSAMDAVKQALQK